MTQTTLFAVISSPTVIVETFTTKAVAQQYIASQAIPSRFEICPADKQTGKLI